MRVELQIDANCEEPFAVLHISKLTPSIQEAIKILEDEGIQNIITAQSAGKVFLIDPQTIEVIRTEAVSYTHLSVIDEVSTPRYPAI